ncbi:ParB/RepB/Spo0J family partition protein [Streptomyces sp. NPDC059008]|uniref:ParB/RepB/Spo0J family partition protein n=1 Tax=Streptomyces sp. NPDC059008 TaxID=3346693 RepID=UPI00368DDE04
MSKASKLGSGSSFQQTQRVSPRRQAINAATKAPTEGTPPPVELPVSVISVNPANPRSSMGDLTELAGSLRDHGQKTAISIMSRFTYLEANPEREKDLEPDTRYVAIDGSTRLEAAREAGLTKIKVMLDDDLGSNPDELLESALVANIHRQDLDHLDEARALKQLLAVHGTQEALAARLHRSQGWVSQRLALLGLTPELQKKLETGEEPADLLRLVGRKKAEEQEQHLQQLKEKRAQAKSDQQAGAKVRKGTAAVPDPRQEPEARPRQVKMPWADGEASMDIIFSKVVAPERHKMIGRYLQLLGSPEAFAADLTAASSAEYRQQLAELLLKANSS